jgi:hypothetical protein
MGSIPAAANADSFVVGDVVKFSDLPGTTGGGEFKLTDVTDPADWIITFCLQKTEYMNFTNNFIVGSITPHTLTDPDEKGGVDGKDWISSETAWLYTQFTDGTLSNYSYTNTPNAVFVSREASANALQRALWMLEQEEAVDYNNYYYNLAKTYTPQNFGIGDVRVLNLYTYNSAGNLVEAQDQLTRVPEPATLAMFGVGVLGLTVTKRQRAKR